MWLVSASERAFAFDTKDGMLDAFHDAEFISRLGRDAYGEYPFDLTGTEAVLEVAVSDDDKDHGFTIYAIYKPHTLECEFDTPEQCETALTSDDDDAARDARACEAANSGFHRVAFFRYSEVEHVAK